jgi:hypothetical protein
MVFFLLAFQNWPTRMFNEIRAAKKERRDELLLIDQELQQLNDEKQQLSTIRLTDSI